MPLVLQTSGGTTGLPRPMLYAPHDRETMAILGGRRFALHGVLPGDMVMVTYSLGLGNGGMAPREALWRYTGAVPVMTGSGATTPTRRQIEIVQGMGRQRRSSAFPSYLRHLALVARDEMGIDPREPRHPHARLAPRPWRTASASRSCGTRPAYDAYGTHESGMMAAECRRRAACTSRRMRSSSRSPTGDRRGRCPTARSGTVYITTLYR